MPEPWLKLDTSITSNPKVMSLPGEVFKCWVCILCETKLYNRGATLPPVPRLAFALHVSQTKLVEHLQALVDSHLLDAADGALSVHDWEQWQRPYPSDSRERVALRVQKHRAKSRTGAETGSNGVTTDTPVTVTVTNGNEREESVAESEVSADVTTSNGRNDYRLEETREEKTREGDSPPVTPPRALRGKRIPADFPLTDDLVAHAASLGIADRDALERWRVDYHNYWSQRAQKGTSLDWVKHCKSRMSADVREGRLRPPVDEGFAANRYERSRANPSSPAKTPPSRAQESLGAGVPELTPAEQSYVEFTRVLTWEVAQEDASEQTRAVVDTLGGWERFQGENKREPPRFPEWVGAFQRSQGRFPGA